MNGIQPVVLLQVQQPTAETADWCLLRLLLVQRHAQGGAAAADSAAGSTIAVDGRFALLLLLLLWVPMAQARLQRVHIVMCTDVRAADSQHCMFARI
jgi:hypothetical protein